MVTDLPRIVHSSLGSTCVDSVLCARCLQLGYPHGAAGVFFLLRVLGALQFVGRLVFFLLERRSGGQGLSEHGSDRDRREKIFLYPECEELHKGGIRLSCIHKLVLYGCVVIRPFILSLVLS